MKRVLTILYISCIALAAQAQLGLSVGYSQLELQKWQPELFVEKELPSDYAFPNNISYRVDYRLPFKEWGITFVPTLSYTKFTDDWHVEFVNSDFSSNVPVDTSENVLIRYLTLSTSFHFQVFDLQKRQVGTTNIGSDYNINKAFRLLFGLGINSYQSTAQTRFRPLLYKFAIHYHLGASLDFGIKHLILTPYFIINHHQTESAFNSDISGEPVQTGKSLIWEIGIRTGINFKA